MGLFDKFISSGNTSMPYKPKNEQEAWTAIAFACASIDGDISEVESKSICEALVFKTMFKGHEIIDYYKNAIDAKKSIGSKDIIDSCVQFVVEENKATLFSIVCEILLSDAVFEEDEKKILEYVAKAMNLNDEMAVKIIEVMLIRIKGNVILK